MQHVCSFTELKQVRDWTNAQQVQALLWDSAAWKAGQILPWLPSWKQPCKNTNVNQRLDQQQVTWHHDLYGGLSHVELVRLGVQSSWVKGLYMTTVEPTVMTSSLTMEMKVVTYTQYSGWPPKVTQRWLQSILSHLNECAAKGGE